LFAKSHHQDRDQIFYAWCEMYLLKTIKPEKARHELGKDARKRMAHYSKTM
jgi:hypothetical protein